jgi:hypothetical protein
MENQLLYFKRGGKMSFTQGSSPSQTVTLTTEEFGDVYDKPKANYVVQVLLGVDKTSSKINGSHITASGVDTDDNGSNDTVLAGTLVTIPGGALTDSGAAGTLVIAGHGTANGVTLEEKDTVYVTYVVNNDDEFAYVADKLLSIRQDGSGTQTELRFPAIAGADAADTVVLYHAAGKGAEVVKGLESILNATKRTGAVSFDAQESIFPVDHVTAIGYTLGS